VLNLSRRIPPRARRTSATIALDPPKPPAVIRTKDRTEAHEQILADHRTMLGEQMRAAEERSAAVIRDVLAEHRRLLEDAAERNRQQFAEHRTMLAEQVRAAEERSAAVLRDVLADHRQQFAELLTQHRTELHGASVARAEDAQATADLRALVAEQTRVMQEAHVQLSERTAEQSRVLQEAHVQLSEQTANLNEAIGSLGESVYRLTIAYFAPTSAPSSGPTQSAASVDTDDKADTAASPASAPALKPTREAPQSIHSILAGLDLTASTPTPRQIKAQEDATNQRRVHEDLEHYDDEFLADVVDPDDAALTNSEELKGSSRCLPPTT
jgi:ABC-type transporter Mla subunit MlaD